MPVTIYIKSKRLFKETPLAYSFLTTVYGGEFFSIPRSQVLELGFLFFENEDWLHLVVSDWIFAKNEKVLKYMEERGDCNFKLSDHVHHNN